MTVAAVVWLQQTAANPLSDGEQRFLLWVLGGLITVIGAMIGFGGKHLFSLMHADRVERKDVVRRVEDVADAHRAEVKEIYERIHGWNDRTAAALSSVEVRLTRIEDRLPSRPKRRASA